MLKPSVTTYLLLPLLVVLLSAGGRAADKTVLIVKEPHVDIYTEANPEATRKKLPRLSILEITGEESAYQRSWYRVRYIDMEKSAVRDTTGYIEIAPDLKDIVPVSSLRNAVLHLSLDPPAAVTADLMKVEWDYTGDMHEEVLEGASEYEEIVKEYYKVRCRLFVPEKVDGIILNRPDFYYHAFTEEDAVRRVKAVEAHPKWAAVFKEKILGGFITEQMTRDMVRASWGDPRKVNKGVPQVWLYGTAASPIQVEFLKGRVAAWSR